jgi:hypothetical protein
MLLDAERVRDVETERREVKVGRNEGDPLIGLWVGRMEGEDGWDRKMSIDVFREVSISENVFDFLRALGKNPSVWRGRRAISVGWVSFGRRTQESCFQGGSISIRDEAVEEGGRCSGVVGFEDDGESLCHPFTGDPLDIVGLSCMVNASSPSRSSSSIALFGFGTGRPLTPHASTGRTIVSLACIGSLGHILFALRSTAG